MSDTELREALAALAHEQWSGWMGYMFGKGIVTSSGSLRLPPELVQRWDRQMRTPYAELPEEEKESDRKEADRVLALIASREGELKREMQAIFDLYNERRQQRDALKAAAGRVIECWGEPEQTWYAPDMEEAVAELRRLVGPGPTEEDSSAS